MLLATLVAGLDPADPSTLLLLDFLPLACSSPTVLAIVYQNFTAFITATQPSSVLNISSTPPNQTHIPPPNDTPLPILGASLVIAALLNGASGRAPPWSLEFIPSTFSGLFQGLGNQVGAVLLALRIGRYEASRSEATS